MIMNKKAVVFFLLILLTSCQSFRPVVFEKPQFFVVNVEGAVVNPGEFQVKPYATLQDLLDQVILKDNSDLSSFNLKMILKHHDKITIPIKQMEACININNATAKQLTSLNRIGEVIALRIINYRDEHGFFQRVEDLMFVKGIGESTFEKNKHRLCL